MSCLLTQGNIPTLTLPCAAFCARLRAISSSDCCARVSRAPLLGFPPLPPPPPLPPLPLRPAICGTRCAMPCGSAPGLVGTFRTPASDRMPVGWSGYRRIRPLYIQDRLEERKVSSLAKGLSRPSAAAHVPGARRRVLRACGRVSGRPVSFQIKVHSEKCMDQVKFGSGASTAAAAPRDAKRHHRICVETFSRQSERSKCRSGRPPSKGGKCPTLVKGSSASRRRLRQAEHFVRPKWLCCRPWRVAQLAGHDRWGAALVHQDGNLSVARGSESASLAHCSAADALRTSVNTPRVVLSPCKQARHGRICVVGVSTFPSAADAPSCILCGSCGVAFA